VCLDSVLLAIMGDIQSEWDRPEQRRFAFPTLQILNGMIRRHINIPYFSVARRNLQAVVEVYAMGRCGLEGWDPNVYARVLAAAEVAGVCLPNDCFGTEQFARRIFVRSVLHYHVNRGTWSSSYSTGVDQGGFQAMACGTAESRTILGRAPVDAPPETIDATVRLLLGLGPDVDLTDHHYTSDLAEAVAEIVDFLCTRATARTRAAGANQYTCTYIAVGKRGTVTTNKLTAINQAVSTETNLDINVTEDQVKALGTALCTYVTEVNAQQVMTTLAQNMTGYSLRLQLTVQQTLRAGMTQYWAIIEAFAAFPTFEWGEASRYIPVDFQRFNIAVGLVQGNQYYGFRRDLGDAAHTKYKSLAWLAVQLLIRYKGAEYGSLRQYRGVTRTPDRQAELQALIDGFVPPADDHPMPGVGAIVERARDLINNLAAAQ